MVLVPPQGKHCETTSKYCHESIHEPASRTLERGRSVRVLEIGYEKKRLHEPKCLKWRKGVARKRAAGFIYEDDAGCDANERQQVPSDGSFPQPGKHSKKHDCTNDGGA
jgi:hypothetical protein